MRLGGSSPQRGVGRREKTLPQLRGPRTLLARARRRGSAWAGAAASGRCAPPCSPVSRSTRNPPRPARRPAPRRAVRPAVLPSRAAPPAAGFPVPAKCRGPAGQGRALTRLLHLAPCPLLLPARRTGTRGLYAATCTPSACDHRPLQGSGCCRAGTLTASAGAPPAQQPGPRPARRGPHPAPALQC